ncbi:hypothetical protein K435DRAFT_296701 [Dendrothele bispora CBS 962.96]|uniref:Uncharacterized protein n=1 Tax=Dendrothele bispora (strain CBS 962.96) TaxID=1314807 RepID=A0A4S8LJB8_DENBC|nr:hypothetical protein K435DRAFT_296701 [Dendrothele bispora CBS 962.96]
MSPTMSSTATTTSFTKAATATHPSLTLSNQTSLVYLISITSPCPLPPPLLQPIRFPPRSTTTWLLTCATVQITGLSPCFLHTPFPRLAHIVASRFLWACRTECRVFYQCSQSHGPTATRVSRIQRHRFEHLQSLRPPE